MRITEITLYRETPLDVDYENVFDGYTTRAELLSFLENYPRKVITPEGVRSKISNDIGLQMVIDGEQDIIREYNYAYVASGTKGFFYFVVDTQSVNDNAQKAQTRITLKWDAFTNNYAEMRSSNRGTKQVVECRHFEECYNNLLEQGRPYTNNIITDEEEIALVQSVYDTWGSKVLWAKITTGVEVEYYDQLSSETPNTWKPYNNYSAQPINGVTHTFYLPFFAEGCTEAMIRAGGTDSHLRYFYTEQGSLAGLFCRSTEVVSVELTWYAPYETTIEDGILYIIFNNRWTWEDIIAGNPVHFGIFRAKGGSGSIVTEPKRGTSFFQLDEPVELLCSPDWSTNVPVYKFGLRCSNPLPNTIDDLDEILPSVDWLSYEPRIYEYPYSFSSIMYNNKIVPIIPPARSVLFEMDVTYVNRPEAEVKMYFQGTNDSPIYQKLKKNGEVQFSASSAEFYMRNNGNSTIVNTLGSLSTNLLKGDVIGAVSTPINIVAKMKDVDNRMDSYSIPETNALNDIHYQDAIRQVVNRPIDDLQLQRVAMKFHYYGININVINDININYHTNFDYIRTRDCKLVSVANRKDRAELEQAYDRGITRWHIKNPYDGKLNNINYLMNKEIYNLSINQYKYYSGVYKEA